MNQESATNGHPEADIQASRCRASQLSANGELQAIAGRDSHVADPGASIKEQPMSTESLSWKTLALAPQRVSPW